MPIRHQGMFYILGCGLNIGNGWHKIYQIGGGFGLVSSTTNVYEKGYIKDSMH